MALKLSGNAKEKIVLKVTVKSPAALVTALLGPLSTEETCTERCRASTANAQSSRVQEVLAGWLLHLITACLTAWTMYPVLQHAHCAHFEAVPANDVIRGSAELGLEGSEFMGWLWGPCRETDTSPAPCVA